MTPEETPKNATSSFVPFSNVPLEFPQILCPQLKGGFLSIANIQREPQRTSPSAAPLLLAALTARLWSGAQFAQASCQITRIQALMLCSAFVMSKMMLICASLLAA
jgi:hypothetical protein